MAIPRTVTPPAKPRVWTIPSVETNPAFRDAVKRLKDHQAKHKSLMADEKAAIVREKQSHPDSERLGRLQHKMLGIESPDSKLPTTSELNSALKEQVAIVDLANLELERVRAEAGKDIAEGLAAEHRELLTAILTSGREFLAAIESLLAFRQQFVVAVGVDHDQVARAPLRDIRDIATVKATVGRFIAPLPPHAQGN